MARGRKGGKVENEVLDDHGVETVTMHTLRPKEKKKKKEKKILIDRICHSPTRSTQRREIKRFNQDSRITYLISLLPTKAHFVVRGQVSIDRDVIELDVKPRRPVVDSSSHRSH